MSTEHTAEIDAVAAAHQFRSTSTSRGHITTRHAGCTCDPTLEFDWYEREAQHRKHLLTAVYQAGRASVTGAENPS